MINLYIVGNETFTNNGDATLQPISATIKKVINGMWQLEMELPYDEEGRYKKVDHGVMLRLNDSTVSEISGTQIWRVYDYKRDTKTLHVIAFPRAMESIFDAPISQLIISTDTTGVNAASALSAVSQKYTVQSNISRTGRSEWTNTNLTKAINGTDENSFTNTWGGEVVYDNLTIKILDGIGSAEDPIDVMYGKNINEISYEVDDSELITRIYPLSTDGIRYWDSTEEVEYIDSDRISDYPIVHAAYLTTPYKLVEDDPNSITRTAQKTADIKSRISTKASQLSHSIWNTAVSNGWKIDYLASIYKDIIANIQSMVTANIAHADFVKVVDSAVSAGMAWMGEQEDPEWYWVKVGEDAYKYGNETSGRYARNEWIYADKKWRWFGDDYLWQQPRDDDHDWTWYENETTHKKWYGTQERYYLAGQYIYITESGTLTKYWLDGDGWYDADKTDSSDYDWHQDPDAGGAWYFGTEDEDGKMDSHLSGCWAFIDGVLYWFDDGGHYYGEKKEQPQLDWIPSGEAYWFGNPDHSYDQEWLASQWAKIDRQWYRFDSSGYTEDIYTEALTLFHNGMGELSTLVQTCRSECYDLLYDLMEEWSEEQFDNGVDVPSVTINVDMIDLSKTTEYANYQNLETIHLGDAVRCVDYVHQIGIVERVVELTYDLLRGYNTSVTIGVANSTVGSMLSGSTGGGTASNNAINVDFIEQSLAMKQPTLEAGKNITLTDNLDGTQTIASDKLIRAGDNVSVTHNADGSDTISAEGGALEYWIEEESKLYRKKVINVSNHFGWDCDSDFKWVNDGAHYAFFVNNGVVAPLTHYAETDTEAACYGFAKVNEEITAIGISATALVFLHRYYSGDAPVYSFEYNGVTLYYASLTIGVSDYNNIVWESQTPWSGPTTSGRHFPLISGTYTSVADARDALIQQAHFRTKETHYTGESVDGQVIWGGVVYSVGEPSSVTPSQMQFYVTNEGIVEGKGYKINGVDLYNIFQQILTAGDNIQIAADGKTISATDTDELTELTDVSIDDQTLANGNVLKWNSTSEKWENGIGGSGFYKMTPAQYDLLPTSEKENPEKLYFLKGEGATTYFIDETDVNNKIQTASVMSVTNAARKTTVTYNNGMNIGAEIDFLEAVDVTEVEKIKYKLKTGGCYGHQNANVEEQTTVRFQIQIGVLRSFPAGWISDNMSMFLTYNTHKYTNTEYTDSECEIDVSNITGTVYIGLNTHGFTCELSDISYTVGTESNEKVIKYQNVTYAEIGVKPYITMENGHPTLVYDEEVQ